jgi:hypothetical protein
MPEAVEGVIPATGDNPGMLAGLIAGAVAGMPAGLIAGASAGSVVVAGIVPAGAAGIVGALIAGGAATGGGGVVWPNEFSAIVSEQRDTVRSIFIVEGKAGDQSGFLMRVRDIHQ